MQLQVNIEQGLLNDLDYTIGDINNLLIKNQDKLKELIQENETTIEIDKGEIHLTSEIEGFEINIEFETTGREFL